MRFEQEELEVIRARWNQSGEIYDEIDAHGVKSPEETELWKKILGCLGDGSLSVLDVGTGTGFIACLLAEMGHRVTAVDWSEAMLARAEEKARQKKLAISLALAETENLPFAAETFDAVVARHLLWTLTDPQQALNEWFRVLKPGGQVMADYSHCSPDMLGKHYPVEIGEKLPLAKNIEPGELAAYFTRAGFVDVRVEELPRTSRHTRTTYLVCGFKGSPA
ncbi:MAG: class I SAM-dependent methyltransferase [Firmicutes bacterium]|nr:class I SAM-dependent methyltransferase [Bacillota bacterium]